MGNYENNIIEICSYCGKNIPTIELNNGEMACKECYEKIREELKKKLN